MDEEACGRTALRCDGFAVDMLIKYILSFYVNVNVTLKDEIFVTYFAFVRGMLQCSVLRCDANPIPKMGKIIQKVRLSFD